MLSFLSFLSASIGRMRHPVRSFHSKWHPTTLQTIETENRYCGSPICWSKWINHHNPASLNIWCCNRQGSNWNWRCHRKTEITSTNEILARHKRPFQGQRRVIDRNWLIKLSRYYGYYDFYRQQLTQMKVLTNFLFHCSSEEFICPAENIEMEIRNKFQTTKKMRRCTIKVLWVLIYRLIDQINVWEKKPTMYSMSTRNNTATQYSKLMRQNHREWEEHPSKL